MTYLEKYDLGSDPEFRERCMMALLDVCVAIMAEDPITEGHEQRVELAQSIMANSESSSTAMAITAAASGMLTALSTDQQFYDTLLEAWNTYAGVSVTP